MRRSRPGCDLTALDPIRPRLSRDHHRQDCDYVKELEFSHAFSLCVTDPYAGYLIADLRSRLDIPARVSIFSNRDHGYGIGNMGFEFGSH